MQLFAAEQARMKHPDLELDEKWDAAEFPHFTVFCNVQLGRPITWGEHWENAKIIEQFLMKILKQSITKITRSWIDVSILNENNLCNLRGDSCIKQNIP